jgi:hypothetical protein
LKARWNDYPAPDGLSPEATLFLLHEIPKMMLLEQAVGVSAGHREVRKLVEQRLDAVEPRRRSKARRRRS